MKKLYLTFLLLIFGLLAQAQNQNISVADFHYAEGDLTARTYGTSVEDQNGRTCALIKVETTEKGLWTFDVGMMGVTKTEMQNAAHSAEIWVWVPFGVTWISIQHDKLGKMNRYYFPCSIDEGNTYIMKLTTAKINVILEKTIDQQFLVFNVTPKDAIVTVDGEPLPVNDGRAEKRVKIGKHDYRIEAQDYHTEVGKVEVGPNNREEKTIVLKPAFGYLKIEGNSNLLSQATVYVDKANGAEALKNGMKLGSGQHTVRVIHSKYKPYERTVTISDGETSSLTVNLDANFSTVTLRVDDDAEIYVNGERVGERSWTGDLEAGDYLIECRKQNHRNSQLQKTITDNMSGAVVQLVPPAPINGRLVVSSVPSGAKILIDGKEMGDTPMQLLAILIGNHTLRLEKEGCAPLAKTITIEEGKTLTLNETLDTGRSVVVKTDRSGDKIYVDGDFVGETPRETPLGFGHHTIRVVRNGVKVEKEVDIKESTRNGLDLVFEFGRLITIRTDHDGDVVMVDGNRVGYSPVNVDLPEGRHNIRAERDKKYDDKDIEVQKEGGETDYYLVLHGETASDFVKNGVNFVTLNGAYDFDATPSYGFCVGSVKTFGWFVTAMSNFQFDAMKYNKVTDANGLVEGSYPSYTGSPLHTRISVMGGLVYHIDGPVYIRLGAGYGSNITSQKSADGNMVRISNYSYEGVDATAGLQLNLKGFTLTADAVTTNFKTIEAKIGLGYCWKR